MKLPAMTERDNSDERLLQELLTLEHKVWAALMQGDAAADAALLLPEFLGIYPTGFAGRDDHPVIWIGAPELTSTG